jgi:hypothetical protein
MGRAAEQARLKDDLNSFAQIFGVKINLSNNLAIRDAVVDWVKSSSSITSIGGIRSMSAKSCSSSAT